MGWKDLSYWFKGAFIGTFAALALSFFYKSSDPIGLKLISFQTFFGIVNSSPLIIILSGAIIGLLPILFGFLIGALIGWIVGKFKEN
ncbi:MAG: hypothetical protein KKE23_03980 [Nanoarchaeota archaeon]|nr:hypothetical protein [Nanoarchaeota archaeon]